MNYRMSYRLRIRLAAEADVADVAEAAQWYNERQLGLGEKFVREVDQSIVRILENPLAFPVILRRYEVKDDAVVVHAVLHGHREDRHWKDRCKHGARNYKRRAEGGGGKVGDRQPELHGPLLF